MAYNPWAWLNAPVWQGFLWTPGNTHAHSGVDLGMSPGTPLTAPMDGEIISAGQEKWGGQVNELVTINGKPYVLSWLHLKTVQARPGPVKAGQQIGLSGTPPPGYGSGSHTHFEMTTGSVPPYMGYNPWHPTATSHPVNPLPYIALWKVLGAAGNGGAALGGVQNDPGTKDATGTTGGASSGGCKHNLHFPGVAGAGATDICLDAAVDFSARGALLVVALVCIIMALAIFAGGNPTVQGATHTLVSKAVP